MCIRKITDVNIVTYATAVPSIIISAENFYFFSPSHYCFQHNRQQIIRFMLQPIQLSIHVIACSIEVAQTRKAHSPELTVPSEQILNYQFCVTVKVQRFRRMRLVQRKVLRLTVHCCTRGKDEIFNFRCCCSIEQVDRSRDVVFCIFFRLCHRLSRSFQGRHVDD